MVNADDLPKPEPVGPGGFAAAEPRLVLICDGARTFRRLVPSFMRSGQSRRLSARTYWTPLLAGLPTHDRADSRIGKIKHCYPIL